MSDVRLFSGRSGWRSGNAGDEVSAPIIHALTGRHVQVMAEPENAEIFGAGSILHNLPPDSRAVVWGSGLIREENRVDSSATPIALRGPLTARRWAGCPDVPFGDPGLLVSRVWAPWPKRWRLGIVPHYIDGQDERVTAFARRNQDTVTVIDICGHVADVCGLISSCEYVLASSLHGLIFADAYGVPNARLVLSERIVGGSFKFRDYLGAFGRDQDPLDVPFTGGERVEALVSAIEDTWEQKGVECVNDGLVVALTAWLEDRDAAEARPEPVADEPAPEAGC